MPRPSQETPRPSALMAQEPEHTSKDVPKLDITFSMPKQFQSEKSRCTSLIERG